MTSFADDTRECFSGSTGTEFLKTDDFKYAKTEVLHEGHFEQGEGKEYQITDGEVEQSSEEYVMGATDLSCREEKLTQNMVSNNIYSVGETFVDRCSPINAVHDGASNESHQVHKTVYISYSPEADFVDKQFVIETMGYLKRHHLSDNIWLDINECPIDGPLCYLSRIDAIMSARVVLLFFSESYLSSNASSISVFESKLLSRNAGLKSSNVMVLVVLYKAVPSIDAQLLANTFNAKVYDLTRPEFSKKTLSEKSQLIGQILATELVKLQFITPSSPLNSNGVKEQQGWKSKRMCKWTTYDVAVWLTDIGVKSHHQKLFREQEITGVLLEAVSETDLLHSFGIRSLSVRSAIHQKKVAVLNGETKLPSCWYLNLRRHRRVDTSNDCVFIVHDSLDLQLVNSLHSDLSNKGIPVLNNNHHNLTGKKSLEEVLKLKSQLISMSSFVIVLLTNATLASTSMLPEMLCCVWLEKKIVTLIFDNVWSRLPTPLQCLLGDRLAVDFSSHLYEDTLLRLVSFLKPKSVTGIVLEQSFIDSINNSFQPLSTLSASLSAGRQVVPSRDQREVYNVYISYHLDSRDAVENIHRLLVGEGLVCHLDTVFSYQTTASQMRALNNGTASSGESTNLRQSSSMIVCLTSKYLQSPVCSQQLIQASQHGLRIIPVMLCFSVWPPEGSSARIRRILARYVPIDLSNVKTYSRNMKILINTIYKVSVYST